MAYKRYRSDKIISNALHYPAVGDIDSPLFLYTKVPEYDGRTENSEIGYSKSSYYGEWLKKKEQIYSSPRNIRSVYIHKNGVSILLFKEPVGIKGIRHSRKYIKMESDILYGNPFNALYKPLVCSNIEEIYIDISIIMQIVKHDNNFVNDLMSIDNRIIQELMSFNSRNGAIIQSDIPMKMFGTTNIGSFGRVRTIAITKNIYDGNEDKFLVIPTKDNKYARTIEVRANELKQQQSSVMVSMINSNNSSYGNLATSPNIYMFDRNVLSAWANKFQAEFTSTVSKVLHEYKTSETCKEVDKLTIEIERLKGQYGEKVADMIIKAAISTMRKDDIEKIGNYINI